MHSNGISPAPTLRILFRSRSTWRPLPLPPGVENRTNAFVAVALSLTEPVVELAENVTNQLVERLLEIRQDAGVMSLAEETRIGMLVGVAVGWELSRELESK